MEEETGRSIDELMSELQQDISHYKATGSVSEKLRDFLHIHHHGKKQQADEAALAASAQPVVGAVPANVNGIGGIRPPVTKPGQAVRDLGNPFKRTLEEIDPLEEELNKLAELAGIAPPPVREGKTETDVEVEVDTPAVAPQNDPKPEYKTLRQSTMGPGEGDIDGEKNNYGGPGDNTMKQQPNRPAKPVRSVKEAFAQMEASISAEYESIKKKA
jgi:hypothetical protein